MKKIRVYYDENKFETLDLDNIGSGISINKKDNSMKAEFYDKTTLKSMNRTIKKLNGWLPCSETCKTLQRDNYCFCCWLGTEDLCPIREMVDDWIETKR